MRGTRALGQTVFRVVVALTALFLLMPTLIVIPISFGTKSTIQFPPDDFSFQWYATVFLSAQWRSAAANSLIVAIAASLFSLLLGTATAMALSRVVFRGKGAFVAFLLSPLVTPVVVLSLGIYLVFARWGLSGTLIGLTVAHTVLALPFVIVSVLASLAMINPSLEQASAGLGAGRWRTFQKVTMPLILPGILSGGVFAFITSWDEAVIAIFLTNSSTRTVPVLIWNQVRTMLDPSTAAVGSLLIIISSLAMLVSLRLRLFDK